MFRMSGLLFVILLVCMYLFMYFLYVHGSLYFMYLLFVFVCMLNWKCFIKVQAGLSTHAFVRIGKDCAVEPAVHILCITALGCDALMHTVWALADHVSEVWFPPCATCAVADSEQLESQLFRRRRWLAREPVVQRWRALKPDTIGVRYVHRGVMPMLFHRGGDHFFDRWWLDFGRSRDFFVR